jgi:tetratricopeptide (TPR) repeat protein
MSSDADRSTGWRTLKEKVMVRIYIFRVSLALAVLLLGRPPDSRAAEAASVQEIVTEAQVALRHRHYSQASRSLQDALVRFPGNAQLQLELGRVYVYQRQDARAMEIFRAILRDDPSNREAKLELARVLSYDKKYEDDLLKNQSPLPASHEGNALNRLQADANYFSDTAGNRAMRAGQRFDLQLGRNFTNTFRLDEKSLWVSQGPKANIFSVNEEGRVRVARWLFIGGGGGIVRFADNSNRALYRGELILHPKQSFWLQGGFSRIPITPTFQASQFDLLAEGWWARLDWQPRSWRISADFSKQHYSDSNRTQREDALVLRWLGNSHFAVGLGYQYAHSSFTQSFANGYFSPNQYHSHLGLGGFRFSIGKIYRGEYIADCGAETVDQNPYQVAWEATAKNRFLLGKLEMGADYSYFHVAQSTGAFRAQVGRASVAYRF